MAPARLDLLAKEKELTRLATRSTRRGALPMVEITKDFVTQSARTGAVSRPVRGARPAPHLSLHVRPGRCRGVPQLLVHDDDVGRLASVRPNASFAVMSRTPLEKLERFRKRLGWTVP